MIEILEFIFENPLHFFGFVLLWYIAFDGIANIGPKVIIRREDDE